MRRRIKKRLQAFSFLVAGASVTQGCGRQAQPDASQVQLTNALNAERSQFPAVVQLTILHPEGTKLCTAFFVNEHQAMTAAHCVADLAATPEAVRLWREFSQVTSALSITVHPQFQQERTAQPSAFDIAVLDFPVGSAPGSLRFAKRHPAAQDAVTLIGFGSETNTQSGLTSQVGTEPGLKRYGQNTIKSLSNGLIILAGLSKSKESIKKGQYVATGLGDSGSPILLGQELVAMSIAGELREGGAGQIASLTYAIDLTSPESQAFLNSILD